MMLLALSTMAVVLIVKFNPKKDTLPNGDKILWYNSGGRCGKPRDYIIYKKKLTKL